MRELSAEKKISQSNPSPKNWDAFHHEFNNFKGVGVGARPQHSESAFTIFHHQLVCTFLFKLFKPVQEIFGGLARFQPFPRMAN